MHAPKGGGDIYFRLSQPIPYTKSLGHTRDTEKESS